MSEEDLPKVVTVEEQAIAAGKIVERTAYDFIRAFDEHAKKIIDNANLTEHHKAMALSKLAELVYWLKAG
jgi:hypothetical protein